MDRWMNNRRETEKPFKRKFPALLNPNDGQTYEKIHIQADSRLWNLQKAESLYNYPGPYFPAHPIAVCNGSLSFDLYLGAFK